MAADIGIYKVAIYKGDDLVISSNMSENFNITLNSEYEAVYANAINEQLDKSAAIKAFVQGASSATGFSVRNKNMTAQYWQGNSPLEMTLPFSLKAQEDPLREVVQPIKDVTKLVLPQDFEGSGQLIAPNSLVTRLSANQTFSQILKSAVSPDEITIFIGRYVIIPSVVVLGVSQDYDTIYNEDGIPISAKLQVQVRTSHVLTQGDIDSMFPTTLPTI